MSTYRVLVVDDERDMRELLELVLMRAGYSVVSVESGEAALLEVAARPPDLILMDALMPEMDGFETTAKLKANRATAHLPVLLVTALTGREVSARALAAGARAIISKPVERGHLVRMVKHWLLGGLGTAPQALS